MFRSFKGLLLHTSQTHFLTSKEYYDSYLKKEGEGFCPLCGKETKFRDFKYADHCSYKCSNSDPKVQFEKEKTFFDRYLVRNISQFQGNKDKIRKCWEEKLRTQGTKIHEERSKKTKKSWEDTQIRKNHIDAIRSQEVRKKISEETKKYYKDNPGVNSGINSKLFRKTYEEIMGEERARELRDKRREAFKGDKNPSWNPNREEICTLYTEKFFDKEYREQIKKEQGYKDLVTEELLVEEANLHHINYNKQDDSRENLIFLNPTIHGKTNFDKQEWKLILQKINRITKELYNSLSKEQLKEDISSLLRRVR